jgi:hypothetical protein
MDSCSATKAGTKSCSQEMPNATTQQFDYAAEDAALAKTA